MSKHDEGKYEPTLVYASLIEGISRVRRYGIKKYGSSEDWRTTPCIRHFDAMLRHIFAYIKGETDDEVSGLSHLYHAAANVMFEIERRYGARSVRGKLMFGGMSVDVICPRCKSKDTYPLGGIYLCTGGCGYFIEPELMEKV